VLEKIETTTVEHQNTCSKETAAAFHLHPYKEYQTIDFYNN
jgi:hypothetical protein